MNKPNLFGKLADRLESLNLQAFAPVLLLACGVGFWILTGSFFAALFLTVLAAIPLAMLTGLIVLALWLGLRLLDGLRRLFSAAAGH